jgi:hypothetical protein
MTATAESVSGVYLDHVSPGSTIDLETKSRHYRIECLGGDKIRISGHPRLCPTPILAQLWGSILESGRFETGFLGQGMRLVFRPFNEQLPITTSEIANIRVESPRETGLKHWAGKLMSRSLGLLGL